MEVKTDAKKLANEITVTVKIKRYHSWRIRLWIAVKLISFAAWLAWLNVDFQEPGIDETIDN